MAVLSLIIEFFGEKPFNFELGSATIAVMSWWNICLAVAICTLCFFALMFIFLLVSRID
ncbi:MAG: hypothetical protein GF317_11105 [Candidatus Lokiarchaeota archaeon]|nr:hypothetical protein [Candidatus Lokiarchaeota archaeon]